MRRISFNARSIVSFASFYAGWWACAFGAAQDVWWLGPAVLPGLLAVHLRLSPTPQGEALFLLALGIFGFAFDTLLIQCGLFSAGLSACAPAWLVGMWVLLGLTFEGWLLLRGRPWMLLGLGAVSGPLTYLWGEGLSIIQYTRPMAVALALHAVIWASVIWFLFILRDLCVRAGLKLSGRAVKPEGPVISPIPVKAEPRAPWPGFPEYLSFPPAVPSRRDTGESHLDAH